MIIVIGDTYISSMMAPPNQINLLSDTNIHKQWLFHAIQPIEPQLIGPGLKTKPSWVNLIPFPGEFRIRDAIFLCITLYIQNIATCPVYVKHCSEEVFALRGLGSF